jgi:L-alanine-DL-glutamate epimerase-like enolase superfamily enzyme
MSLYDRLADLPLEVDAVDYGRHQRETTSEFTRTTTVISLHGEGATGRGEDVTYETADHDALQAADPSFDLAGSYTVDSFSKTLADRDLFHGRTPDQAVFRNYRRWGFESAALDLALRQAETDLASALDRTYEPVEFIVSTRLGSPPSTERIETLLDRNADLEFKLDPTDEWTAELIQQVADTGRVRILDLKGQYDGTDVDQAPDPTLYGRLLEAFPAAVIEDPALTDETEPLFEGHREQVSWDAPIHGVDDVESLPFAPDWLNIKPSRFGSLASLLATIEYCTSHGIRMYGGGQFELGVGRQQLHALASLLYPDGPNDIAPAAYNVPTLDNRLPRSPLSPPESPIGFGWPPASVDH